MPASETIGTLAVREFGPPLWVAVETRNGARYHTTRRNLEGARREGEWYMIPVSVGFVWVKVRQ